jgi:hypothetical protein
MTCDAAGKLIPLYGYGELLPEEEEQVEAHLHECPACAGEQARQQRLAAALDRRQLDDDPSLLADCRRDLLVSLYRDEAQAPRKSGGGAWRLFLDAVAESLRGVNRYRQPVAAMALLTVGYFAARFTTATPSPVVSVAPALSEQVYATVRSVQPDASGAVQIAFDETRRRTVSGRMEDDNIRRLLLAAARDDNNPAVRVESVDALKGAAASGEVRAALLDAVAHDGNLGVRLKALEGLKPLSGDPQVRKALAGVLLTDENPAVRMQVIDLLVERRDDSMVGVLQNAVQQDNNSYVRQKCAKALKDWNASIGTF